MLSDQLVVRFRNDLELLEPREDDEERGAVGDHLEDLLGEGEVDVEVQDDIPVLESLQHFADLLW